MYKLSTDSLTEIFAKTPPDKLDGVLAEHRGEMIFSKRPFAGVIREILKKHNLTQQTVIRRAGFSDRYGYRLLSEERHTRQRDYIIRICLAAECTGEETQQLLRLYGMSPLYARLPRDAVLISAISAGITDPEEIDRLLIGHGMQELKKSEEYIE